MTIRFTEYPENLPNKIYHLDAKKEDDSLLLSITSTNMINDVESQIHYRLNKNQLKDFIGALLHIQSKLK